MSGGRGLWIACAILVLLTVCLVAACMSDRDEKQDVPGDDDDDDDDDDSGDVDDPIPPVGGDPLSWSDPMQIAPADAEEPCIKIRDAETVHATYYLPLPVKGPHGLLYWLPLTGDSLEPGEPVFAAAEAYNAFWEYDGEHIEMIGSRDTQVVLLLSDDGGQSWTQGDAVQNDRGFNCPGNPAAWYTRDSAGRMIMAFGYEYFNAVFGCTNYVHFSRLVDGEWSESVSAGLGLASAIFTAPDERIVIVGTYAVFVSSDDGESFTEVPDGDTTRTQVRGTDAARMPDGSVWIVDGYMWGDGYALGVIASDPEVQSWTSPYWVLDYNDFLICLPRIKVDGDNVVVAWLASEADEIEEKQYVIRGYSRISRDRGQTWSEKSRIGPLESGVRFQNLSLDAAGGRAVVIYNAGGGETYGEGGVFVSTAEY